MTRKPDWEEQEECPVEKTDPLAMWLSGMLVIGVPFLIMIAVVAGVLYLLFGRG